MSRVDFAYGATHRLQAACRTAARHVAAGHRLLVYCSDGQRLRRFDLLLWAFDPTSFIPHAPAADPLAGYADVVLCRDEAELGLLPAPHWLLNLDLACPPAVERFARVLEIVSGHEADIRHARERWQAYRLAGHEVRGHQLPAAQPGT